MVNASTKAYYCIICNVSEKNVWLTAKNETFNIFTLIVPLTSLDDGTIARYIMLFVKKKIR